jgi:DNA-binding transcriptional LysR family regulator
MLLIISIHFFDEEIFKMELRNVFTFIRAVDLGSFTKAAQELGYSQSTVTFQIKQLESELGIPLFDRIGRKVTLTPLGEEFMTFAIDLIKTTSKIKAIGTQLGMNKVKLRVGTIESLFMGKLAELIPSYFNLMPSAQIETKTADSVKLYQMLRSNELDIIFVLDRKIHQKECIRAFASPVNIVFVASSKHPITKEKNINFSDIVKQPLVLTERDSIYRRVLEEKLALLDIELTPFLEVDNTSIIMKLIKEGLGISFLPEYIVKEDVKNNKLTILPVQENDITLFCQIFYNKNKWVSPQMKLFINLMSKE